MSDREKKSIERIQLASKMSLHYYGVPLLIAYSGGKDSDVLVTLAERSGIPFEVEYSLTTVDAPQTIYHVRDKFKRLEERGYKTIINKHQQADGTFMTMWRLIVKKGMPPTRIARYCCQVLKEGAGIDRMIATGVRWAESNSRKSRESFEILGKTVKDAIRLSVEIMLNNDNDEKRKFIERCEIKSKTIANPIIDWSDADIWEYYWTECESHNDLYKCGYYRVGCVGCPLGGRKNMLKEFHDFPTYERAYKRAFAKMIENNRLTGKLCSWKDANECFDWWLGPDGNIDGQLSLDLGGE